MTTDSGDIAITRPDGLLAAYAVPGQPERRVALKRRDPTELITEELRRMDADLVYEQTVQGAGGREADDAGGAPEILVHADGRRGGRGARPPGCWPDWPRSSGTSGSRSWP